MRELRWSELAHYTPKQTLAARIARDPRYKYVLYGGSRGPGKSYLLRWDCIDFLTDCPIEYGLRNVVVGLFCEDYPQLKDRQIGKIEKEFPPWLGELKTSKAHGLGFHLHESYGGGVLALRNLDKPAKYQSAEFARISVDELTKNPVETFNTLRGSLRWPGIPDQDCKFVAGSNPGSIGHMWVKNYWIDRQYPEELQGEAERFAFIPALPDDNEHLDPAYWYMLDTLPHDMAMAWRHGSWDVFEGQAFGRWRKGHHTCKPFTIPAPWLRWRGLDWGFAKPFCCLWLTMDPDIGRLFAYREAYFAGLTDRAQARLIKKMTPENETIAYTLADPSMWTLKSMEERTFSSADEYKAGGVTLMKADNKRVLGKRKVDTLLEDLPDGLPGLIVFDNCTNLIRTLPALPYDKVDVEDVDSAAEDHAYDAVRYGLTKVNPRPVAKHPVVQKVTDPMLIKAGIRAIDPITRMVVEGDISGRDL